MTFHVHELSRLTGGVNTMVGNNEGSVGIGCRMPNVLGRGERVSFDYNYGTKKSSHYAGTLSRPLHRWRGAGYTYTFLFLLREGNGMQDHFLCTFF